MAPGSCPAPPPPRCPSASLRDRGVGPRPALWLAGAVLGAGLLASLGLARSLPPAQAPALAAAFDQPRAMSAAFSSLEVIAQVRRAVTLVTVTTRGTTSGVGSGFYIGERLVVTTAHVLSGAQSIAVQLDLGRASLAAEFVGWDTARDVGLLRLVADPGVPPLALRPTERRAVGLPVLSLGFPIWSTAAEPSASAGIISRYLEWPGLGWMLETDARCNPGADGGPIVDSTGAVVGMSQGWVASTWPVHLAVTSDQISALLPILRRYGGWSEELPYGVP